MVKIVKLLPLFIAVSVLGACGSSMSSVPVQGEDKELAALAGEWKGEFEGDTRERRGTIAFDLELGRHTANAKVIMNSTAGAPVDLKVEYLKVVNGQLRGKIEPYMDPGCNCTVNTEFEGSLTSGFIVGTYVAAMDADGKKLTGQWSAERIDD
jgi:hypothetical protein